MALIVVLDLHLKPDALEQAPDTVDRTLKDTRQFDGCIRVDVVIDKADETHWLLIETWRDAESAAAYQAWRATPAGRSDLGSLLSGRPISTTGELTTI